MTPTDPDVWLFECASCRQMASGIIVGWPLEQHPGIDAIVAFHDARRALRLPTLENALWQ